MSIAGSGVVLTSILVSVVAEASPATASSSASTTSPHMEIHAHVPSLHGEKISPASPNT